MAIPLRTLWLMLWMLMVTGQEQIPDENAIMNYVTKLEKPIERATLVMGEVGSGKTTLALLLTGAELFRKRDLASQRYIYTDKDNRIGNGSMQTPRTVVPNLMSDRDDRYDYYFDCPGFSKSSNTDSDFEKTLIFQKLYHSARKMNFIFTVKYDDDADAFKLNIKNSITNATGIFNNFTKYQNSIALVVTQYPLMAEKIGIDTIGKHLLDVQKKFSSQGTEYKFAEMLQKPAKVGLFHVPHKLQSNSILGSDNRNELLENLIVRVAYVSTEPNDFRCTLNKASVTPFGVFIEKIKDKILKNFYKIIEGIKDFIFQEERRFSNSLDDTIAFTNKFNEELLKVDSGEPLVFKQQFTKMIYNLGIRIAGAVLHKSLQYVEYIELLHIPEAVKTFTVPAEMSTKIQELRNDIRYSQVWNEVLSGLEQYFDDKRLFASPQFNEIDKIEEGLVHLDPQFRDQTKSEHFRNIKSAIDDFYKKKTPPQNIDKYKLELLDGILKQSVEIPVFKCSENKAHMLVTGYNVLMESVVTDPCFESTRHVDIFAMNRFISERPIERYNSAMQMTIISPIWETQNDAFEFAFNFKDGNDSNRFIAIGQTIITRANRGIPNGGYSVGIAYAKGNSINSIIHFISKVILMRIHILF